MRVSIVIPVYNRPDTIAASIESALAEAEEQDEVIVVDDGSTDCTKDVIQQYSKKVRFLSKANGGVSSARNLGIVSAAGKYIKFLDSDDMLIPGGIKALVKASDLNVSTPFVYFGDAAFQLQDVWKNDKAYGFPDQREGPLTRTTLLSKTMSPWLPLYRSADLRAIGGFNEAMLYGEDQDLAVRMSLYGRAFSRIAVPVVQVGHTSATRLSRTKDYSRYQFFAETVERHLKNSAVSPTEADAFGRRIWTLARELARQGDTVVARQLFLQAEQFVGRRAHNGAAAVRLAYKVLPPLFVEKVLQSLKKIIRQ